VHRINAAHRLAGRRRDGGPEPLRRQLGGLGCGTIEVVADSHDRPDRRGAPYVEDGRLDQGNPDVQGKNPHQYALRAKGAVPARRGGVQIAAGFEFGVRRSSPLWYFWKEEYQSGDDRRTPNEITPEQ